LFVDDSLEKIVLHHGPCLLSYAVSTINVVI